MATLDEERYMRNLLLLGKGGMFLLRKLVVKEVLKTGKTLETLMLEKKTSYKNILPEQYKLLFPSPSTANVDLDTWDMSLLLLVVKKLFSTNLPHQVNSAVAALKSYRNSIQGHPNSMSMAPADYSSNRQCIINNLRSIATYVQELATFEEIETKTASESIDIGSVIRQINETQAFSASIQDILEVKMKQINQNLTSLKKDLSNITQSVMVIEKNQKEANEEQKEANEEVKRSLQSVKGGQEDVYRMIANLRQMHVKKTTHDFSREMNTIIEAECENKEKKEKALQLLFTFVKTIQDNHKYEDKEITSIIAQRVEWYGELTLKLLDELIEWFSDVNKICDGVGTARLGSIQLPILCSSVTGLLAILEFMCSNQCKQRLLGISSTISKIFDSSYFLIWKVEPTSLQSTATSFFRYTVADASKEDKMKVILPLQAENIEQMTNVLKMFGGEERNHHVEKVSKMLSEIFGEPIRLKTTVDKDHFLEVVKQIVSVEMKEETTYQTVHSNLKRPFEALEGLFHTKSLPNLSTDRQKGQKFVKASQSSTLSFEINHHSTINVPFIIMGMIAISDNSMFAINREEPVLFELDNSFKVVDDISLPDVPTDLCLIDDDRAAVCLDFMSVVIVGTTSKCIIQTVTSTNKLISINSHDGLLYAVNFEGCVYTSDTNSKDFKQTFEEAFKFNMDCPKKIAVSIDGKLVYLCNKSELFTVDMKGTLVSKLHLQYQVQDICVIGDGTILFCASDSQNLLQIDQYGKSILSKTAMPKKLRYIRAMCYQKAESKLLITDRSRHIHMFEFCQSTS